MTWKIVAVLAAGLLIAADDKKDDKDKDAKKLEGTWAVVSVEHEGKKAPDEQAKDVRVIFTADGKVTIKEPEKEINGTYKIDAGKKVKEIGSLARPDDIRFTDTLPKTRSGKIMRRLLRDIAGGKTTTQDTTTLEDFSVLARLREEEEG